MKKYRLLLCLPGLLTACMNTPGGDNPKEEVKKILVAYYDALKTKNFNQLKELTTPDYLLYENGKAYTIDSVIASFDNIPPFTVTYSFNDLDIKTDHQSSRAHFIKKASFTFNDTTHITVNSLESANFRRTGCNWKLEFNHLTAIN